MFQSARPASALCVRCTRALEHRGLQSPRSYNFTTSATLPLTASRISRNDEQAQGKSESSHEGQKSDSGGEGEGAMSRRLSDMSERNLEEGGRSAVKAVEEAGFDDELKERLLNRIADANFKNENISAFAQASIPTSASKFDRETAAATPWSGTETLEDATLRMLNDARKPLRRPARIPSPAVRTPKKVDTGRPGKSQSSGTGARLANARDKTSVYSYLKDESMSDKDKEQFRKQLKDKFTVGGRPAPSSITGLASLANERIEDAIARGQFKNLPRGKKIERDYNMSSPFIETTEYFMNKIIQKQEIVPPWIEKQQELVAASSKFRGRLRSDWRRHAARLISSHGGSLESQIRRAEQYAAAEAIVNPPATKREKLNTVDKEGFVSQITLEGKLRPPQPSGEETDEAPIKISVQEDSLKDLLVDPHQAEFDRSMKPTGPDETQQSTSSPASSAAAAAAEQMTDANGDNPRVVGGTVWTFRDPHWEETERAYHKAAIENLNSMTRSYNLMAPNLAKKPYFSLDRELRACFADVAPQLPGEIHNRATAPKVKVEVVGHTPGGVLEKFGGKEAKVYDERRPQYGFKEFWRDLFGSKEAQ